MDPAALKTHARHQTIAEARGRLAAATAKINYWEAVTTTPETKEAVDQMLELERTEHDFWWDVMQRIHA
jgi:hypothetical protein